MSGHRIARRALRNAPGAGRGLKAALHKGIGRIGGALALGLLLAGCASDNIAEDADLWDDLVAVVQTRLEPDPAAGTETRITRAMLAGVTDPLIRVTRLPDGPVATLVPAARGGPAAAPLITWRGRDPVTLTTRGGLLVATRGLGRDLMSSDLQGLAQALRAGGGRYARSHVVLVGNTDALTLSFDCTLRAEGAETITILERSVATTRFTEACAGPAGTFGNTYWRGAGDGTLWQSQQWAGPDFGHVRIERLIK